jgi:hypothetical protein
MDFKEKDVEVECGGVDRTNMAQDRAQWWDLCTYE